MTEQNNGVEALIQVLQQKLGSIQVEAASWQARCISLEQRIAELESADEAPTTPSEKKK